MATLPPIKAAPAIIQSFNLAGGKPFPYDPPEDRLYLSSGPSAATDYTKLQILKAAFGLGGVSVPSPFYMGISMTPLYDSGLGLTEFSGSNYSRPTVPTWLSSASTGFSQPSGDVHFPNPTATWWDASDTVFGSRTIWPFITDAATGGNILWYWSTNTFTVDATHPIGFRPSISLASNLGNATGAASWRGGAIGSPVISPMFQGILDTLAGLTTYTPPTLYVWPQATAYTPVTPYSTIALGSITTPAIGSDGHAFCSNASSLSWTAQAMATGDSQGQFPTALQIGDGAGGGVGVLYFLTTMRTLWITAGDTVTIPAGGIVFKVE
jgi:hypothetical protein